MDATTQKLVHLLGSSDLALRSAAIRVIGEIGLSSRPVVQGIARCLREPHEELQLVALKALARLGAGDVAQMVVPLILAPGILREQAMAVVTSIGPSVAPQLQELYSQADFHGKRAVVTALARVGGKPALRFLLDRLGRESFELQKHMTISLCDALDRMDPPAQSPIFPLISQLLKSREASKSPQIRVTGVIALGHFRGPSLSAKARKLLQAYTDKKYPPELRRYAVVSLNRLLAEVKGTPDLLSHLIKLLCDDDWHNIAQHALAAFQRLSIPARSLPGLVDLLKKSPHFSVHIHVLERLQEVNRPEISRAIIPFLADARFRVREAAESALRRIPSAIDSLFQVLMESDDLEVTQRVNSILREFPQETRHKYVERAASKLMALFERNDPRYRSFLEFTRAVDPEPLRKRVYQKCRSLKASRSRDRWARMCAYLQILWENHLITPEGRYHYAVALLRQGTKDIAPSSRRADLGLRVIRALIYDDGKRLTERLKREKELRPEDYYYLGFHFAEEGPEVRPFGIAMLEHVVRRSPKSKVAASAVHKLKLHREASEGDDGAEKGAAAAPAPSKAIRSRRTPGPVTAGGSSRTKARGEKDKAAREKSPKSRKREAPARKPAPARGSARGASKPRKKAPAARSKRKGRTASSGERPKKAKRRAAPRSVKKGPSRSR